MATYMVHDEFAAQPNEKTPYRASSQAARYDVARPHIPPTIPAAGIKR